MPELRRRGPLLVTATKFLTVGAISTLIEVAAFNLLFSFAGASAVTAKIVASLVALVNAYVGNRAWTFHDRLPEHRSRELVRFVVANAVCTGLGAAIVWVADVVLVDDTGSTTGVLVLNAVNLASIAVIVVLRFIAYHWWVFRDDRAPHEHSSDAARTISR